jgi:hypothetical protein
MDELVELLTEVEGDNAVKAAKLAAEAAAQAAAAQAEAARPEAEAQTALVPAVAVALAELAAAVIPISRVEAEPEPETQLASDAATKTIAATAAVSARVESQVKTEFKPAAQGAGKPSRRERRAQSRCEVDTSAVIHLINVGSRVNGRIVDLSLGGCRIRTMDHFPVGIYTRVETEFRLEGLPFRLAGVIQAVHDRGRFNIGIRFLDMSERKREQLEQLICEIEDLGGAREFASAARGAGETGTA